MTPSTLAARVAAECGPLNDTERERARMLAIEHQAGCVAESFGHAEADRAAEGGREGGREAANRVLEALKQNPDLTERDLVMMLKVTRHAVQRARKAWGKPLKNARRLKWSMPATERATAELRKKPELAKLSANALAKRLSVCWDTAARAKERIANEQLTESESVS